jgi:hypothetical protein
LPICGYSKNYFVQSRSISRYEIFNDFQHLRDFDENSNLLFQKVEVFRGVAKMIWSAITHNVLWVMFHTEITNTDWREFLEKATYAVTNPDHPGQSDQMCSLVIHQDCPAPTLNQLQEFDAGLRALIEHAILWKASAVVANQENVALQLAQIQPGVTTPWPLRGFRSINNALEWLEKITNTCIQDPVIASIKSIVPKIYQPEL